VKGERLVQNRDPLVDFCLIPACPILFVKQDEFASTPAASSSCPRAYQFFPAV
jgi:hypothetical protein